MVKPWIPSPAPEEMYTYSKLHTERENFDKFYHMYSFETISTVRITASLPLPDAEYNKAEYMPGRSSATRLHLSTLGPALKKKK